MVIEMDELLDSSHELFVGFKSVEIVHLTFQDAPEALHRAVIDTSANPGHTLLHLLFIEFGFELLVCVLESSVTMEQRMGIRVLLNC